MCFMKYLMEGLLVACDNEDVSHILCKQNVHYLFEKSLLLGVTEDALESRPVRHI
jgi:hypothetical protein